MVALLHVLSHFVLAGLGLVGIWRILGVRELLSDGLIVVLLVVAFIGSVPRLSLVILVVSHLLLLAVVVTRHEVLVLRLGLRFAWVALVVDALVLSQAVLLVDSWIVLVIRVWNAACMLRLHGMTIVRIA